MILEVSGALMVLLILELISGIMAYYLFTRWNKPDNNMVVAKLYGIAFIVGTQIVGIPLTLNEMGVINIT